MATWTAAKRAAYLTEHPENFAGPDGTYPIEDANDVKDAWDLSGRAADAGAIRKKVKAIAKRLGLSSALPKTAKVSEASGVIHVEARIVEAEPLDEAGREIKVTVIKGGKSNNGYFYDHAALSGLARMIEGAQAYADHDTSVPVRSVRDLVGFYHDAVYVAEGDGRVDAILHIMESASWLSDIIVESVKLGKPDLIGLSVDFFGTWQESGGAKRVTGLKAINSCDVVTRPSAGGGFQRIIHSEETVDSENETQQDGGSDTSTLPSELPTPDEAHDHSVTSHTPAQGTVFAHDHEHAHLAAHGHDHTHIVESSYRLGGHDHSHSGDFYQQVGSLLTHSHDHTHAVTHAHAHRHIAGETYAQGHEHHTHTAGDGQIIESVLSHAKDGERVDEEQKNVQEAASSAQAAAPTVDEQRITEQVTSQVDAALAAQKAQFDAALEAITKQRCQAVLGQRIAESRLPDAVVSPIRARFEGRVFEEKDLDGELNQARDMMAALTDQGIIRGAGYERVSVGQQVTEAEKIQAAFDLMFDAGKVPMLSEAEKVKFAGVKGFTSIREAYARVTGDPSVTGISPRSLLGEIRVSEWSPMERITEADTTTASFAYLLGTSMNKRLLKDYQAWPAEWQKLVTIVPIKDFKQQTRVRLGAFGSLPVVPEDSAYSSVSLTDSAASYVAQKRGNLVTVSRETIVNDDLYGIRQIPTKLAVAASYTLAEFVYGFFSNNPTIYDGNALFMTGSPHTNLGTTALSTAAMQLGVTAMREQTNFAGKRIGLRPKYLVVPPELEFTAMVATKSAGVPGSANNDINPMLGYVEPIVAEQLTNTSQWFMVGDPYVIDTIEIGFVGGQINPALFIQDSPLYGLNFTQDVISYKLRHEYGGAVTDWRGLYRGI